MNHTCSQTVDGLKSFRRVASVASRRRGLAHHRRRAQAGGHIRLDKARHEDVGLPRGLTRRACLCLHNEPTIIAQRARHLLDSMVCSLVTVTGVAAGS
jgi:hypothetical protein